MMRNLLLLLCIIFFACNNTANQGFTNKSEAKNLTEGGVKEGKWIEYSNERGQVTDTATAVYYSLVVYNAGKPDGITRVYYKKSGKLKEEMPFSNGIINGVAKEYYPEGNIKSETPYQDGKINGALKIYNNTGKLISETFFRHDTIVVTKNYDENGIQVNKQ